MTGKIDLILFSSLFSGAFFFRGVPPYSNALNTNARRHTYPGTLPYLIVGGKYTNNRFVPCLFCPKGLFFFETHEVCDRTRTHHTSCFTSRYCMILICILLPQFLTHVSAHLSFASVLRSGIIFGKKF